MGTCSAACAGAASSSRAGSSVDNLETQALSAQDTKAAVAEHVEKRSPLHEPSPGEPPQKKHAKYVANSGRERHDPSQVEPSRTGPGLSAHASKLEETAEDMVIPTQCMSVCKIPLR